MPKPTTKKELLLLSQERFKELFSLIDSYPETILEKDFPEGTLNRNIKDVFAHIHHWHLLFLDWYAVGMKGEKPDMPSKGYTWKTVPDLNIEIWKHYQNVSLAEIKPQLVDSFKKVQAIIHVHTNTDLFTKKKYKWTGSTSLGAYLISNTSSHYDWAIKRIKKSVKQNAILESISSN